MADRRAAAISRLADRLANFAGQSATFTRAGAASFCVSGTFTDAASDGELGTFGTAAGLDLTTTDFVCKATDLGGFFPPQSGDEIAATFDRVEHRFAVTREDGEDVYRYADPLRTMIRIHLRHLGAA